MQQHAFAYAASRPGVLTKPSDVQSEWLRRGLTQPGGKLPLFDEEGQRIPDRTVQSCVRLGWAEPWFRNPLKKDWTVCKLTHLGRVVAEELAL
ncbi:MAG: hypothetical protein ACKVHX_07830 [Alphaproteobacteria bacterium]